jgi:hypothetical protein
MFRRNFRFDAYALIFDTAPTSHDINRTSHGIEYIDALVSELLLCS